MDQLSLGEKIAFWLSIALVVVILGFSLGHMAHGYEEHFRQLEDGYYKLEDLTQDGYVEKNEGLQPPYIQVPDPPNIKPLECGIERETPIESYMGVYNSQDGVEVFKYDTNKDGWADVQIRLHGEDMNRYPQHYGFDRDHVIHKDEAGNPYTTPEIIYEDTLRDGTCKGIKVFWTPSMIEKAAEDRKEFDCIRGDCDGRSEGEL